MTHRLRFTYPRIAAQGFSVLLVLAALFAYTPQSPAAIIDNLELHTTLDTADISGATAFDSAGSPQNGTIVGSGITNPTGQIGEALDLPGAASDYVTFGDVLNPGAGDYTVSIWFNPDSLAGGSQFIAGKGMGTSSQAGWRIFLANASLFVEGYDGTNSFAQQTTLVSTTWHHAALVIDRTTDEILGYLNGTNTGWADSGGNGNSLAAASSVTTANPLLLGVRDNNAPGGALDLPFAGLVDDFAIWDRALTAEEIDTIYQNGLDGLNVQQMPIPEPPTHILAGFATLALAAVRRRKPSGLRARRRKTRNK